MGAAWNYATGNGTTVNQAWDDCIARLRYEVGHNPYSGTVKEKTAFVLFTLNPGIDPHELESLLIVGAFAELVEAGMTTKDIADRMEALSFQKWGDAVAVHIGGTKYAFMGMCSC